MTDRDFVLVLREKLSRHDDARGPQACSWDEAARVLTLTYDTGTSEAREVTLSLPRGAVAEFTGGGMDRDVRDVWGDGVDSVEGAARFATIFLDELVHSSGSTVTRLELTGSGIRPVESERRPPRL